MHALERDFKILFQRRERPVICGASGNQYVIEAWSGMLVAQFRDG